jgi:Transposase zinc-ribbon domain
VERALVRAVRAVAAGLSVVPAASRDGGDSLIFSNREREVLILFAPPWRVGPTLQGGPRLPARLVGAGGLVPRRPCLPGVPGAAALAGGFACPRCGETQAWRVRRGLLRCRGCRHESSVTAGTVLAGTRTSLITWFAAAWYVTNQKSGVSALGLKRARSLWSYETAWTILHKLRGDGEAGARAPRRRGRGRRELRGRQGAGRPPTP